MALSIPAISHARPCDGIDYRYAASVAGATQLHEPHGARSGGYGLWSRLSGGFISPLDVTGFSLKATLVARRRRNWFWETRPVNNITATVTLDYQNGHTQQVAGPVAAYSQVIVDVNQLNAQSDWHL